jgi:hypothetical protein
MIGKERLTRRDYPPPVDEIARMIRVDHAGEYGAVRIYGRVPGAEYGPAPGQQCVNLVTPRCFSAYEEPETRS